MVFRDVPIAVFSVCLLCSAHAAAPTASVASVFFSDLDLDRAEISGTVTWTAPADTSQVTKYNVYLATNALGAGKSVVTLNVPIGTNTTNLIENTLMGSFTYVVVMTANADGEQTNAPGSTPLEDQVAVPWTVSAWGACSTSCGQGVGTQTRNVTCSSSNASACDTSVQPPAARGCSSLCPWVAGPWSACNCRRGTQARKATCSANTMAGCESNKPDLLQACDNCGCGDGGEHDAMRPWGHGPMGSITCDAQWWIIFSIIVGSSLLFCCCVALCYCAWCKLTSVTPPEEKAQPDAEKVGPEGCNVKEGDNRNEKSPENKEWEV